MFTLYRTQHGVQNGFLGKFKHFVHPQPLENAESWLNLDLQDVFFTRVVSIWERRNIWIAYPGYVNVKTFVKVCKD